MIRDDRADSLCKKWGAVCIGLAGRDELFSGPGGAEKVTLGLGRPRRKGRSVQPEKVDITIGKVSPPRRRAGGSAGN
jgi:hypothetical protein